MDPTRFDSLARHAAGTVSRRSLFGLAFGSAFTPLAPGDAFAKNGNRKGKGKGKKNDKKKKKQNQNPNLPPVINEHGCIDVGLPCNGDDTLCCSGICEGDAPQKGKLDQSRCVGHNIGGCTPERSVCVVAEPIDAACNLPDQFSVCMTTTGNAGFCANLDIGEVEVEFFCRDCRTDSDCLTLGFAPGSACVVLQGNETCNATCPATAGRACFPPAG